MATLLSIINDAQALLGLPISTSVIGNSGQTQKQLLAIANMDARLLAEEFAWQQLVTQTTFATTATEEQTNATLPSDFGWMINESMFNRTTTDPVMGPVNTRDWQQMKADGIYLTIPRYRVQGNSILFIPTPTAGQNIYYEYVSKNWCESSVGTPQAAWEADNDVPRLPDTVLVLGIIWRWRKSKEIDYTEDFNTWMVARDRAAAREGAKRKLSVVGPSTLGFPGKGNIPEGNWS
jgi:hypothetical protein